MRANVSLRLPSIRKYWLSMFLLRTWDRMDREGLS